MDDVEGIVKVERHGGVMRLDNLVSPRREQLFLVHTMACQLGGWPVGIPEVCDGLISGARARVRYSSLFIVERRLWAIGVVVIAVIKIPKRAVESATCWDVVRRSVSCIPFAKLMCAVSSFLELGADGSHTSGYTEVFVAGPTGALLEHMHWQSAAERGRPGRCTPAVRVVPIQLNALTHEGINVRRLDFLKRGIRFLAVIADIVPAPVILDAGSIVNHTFRQLHVPLRSALLATGML